MYLNFLKQTKINKIHLDNHQIILIYQNIFKILMINNNNKEYNFFKNLNKPSKIFTKLIKKLQKNYLNNKNKNHKKNL